MPLLKSARMVEAARIAQSIRRADDPDSAAELGAMLSRHGVGAEIAFPQKTSDTIGDSCSTARAISGPI